MVRSCERVGWSGGKLHLVWTSLVCIDDSAWFLKALLCCSRLFLVVIFEALSWWFSRCVFGTLLLVIWWGKFVWTLCGSFTFDSPPKSVSSRVRGVLEGWVSIPLDWVVLGTELIAKGSPRGTPTIPKVSLWSVERIGRSIGGRFEFFPRVEFFPTVQTKAGLTSFSNRFDRFSPVGCRDEFLSKEVPVVLWLFLFRGWEVLEAGRVFDFLDRTGLTGFPCLREAKSNISCLTLFQKPAWQVLAASSRVVCVSATCVLWLLVGSCS
jgi:hypothetical protein